MPLSQGWVDYHCGNLGGYKMQGSVFAGLHAPRHMALNTQWLATAV